MILGGKGLWSKIVLTGVCFVDLRVVSVRRPEAIVEAVGRTYRLLHLGSDKCKKIEGYNNTQPNSLLFAEETRKTLRRSFIFIVRSSSFEA